MMTCHELFGFMSTTLANEILHYAHTTNKPLYRATLNAVAESRKVRPIFMERKPPPERNKLILESLTRPRLEAAAAELLRTWLIKAENALLVDFLNQMGIEHKEGIAENFPETVDETKLNGVIDQLLAQYAPEKVVVYLNALSALQVVIWPNLNRLLESEARLQLQ
jgi:hypothetical protein